MRFTLTLTLVIFLGLIAWPPELQAQGQPRACTSHEAGDQFLKSGDSGVVSDDGEFVRIGRSYPFSIFGAGAADPNFRQAPYRLCLRYEFRNNGKEDIQELGWPNAGVFQMSLPIKPGQQFGWNIRTDTNTTSVGEATTHLRAFENASAAARTVFAEKLQINLTPADEGIITFSLTNTTSEFQRALENRKASVTVKAIHLPSKPTEYAGVGIEMDSPDLVISIGSSAEIDPNDQVGTIENEIRLETKSNGKVAVYAPGFLALERTNMIPAYSLKEASSAFLLLLPDASAPLPMRDHSYRYSMKFGIAKDSKEPALFLVQNPITIAVGNSSVCLLAETYSPVPVSLSEEHCRNR